jgi:hypothetical protein
MEAFVVQTKDCELLSKQLGAGWCEKNSWDEILELVANLSSLGEGKRSTLRTEFGQQRSSIVPEPLVQMERLRKGGDEVDSFRSQVKMFEWALAELLG